MIMTSKMFHKFFNVHNPFVFRIPRKPASDQPANSSLRIVHAGGNVEYYYMAIPAAIIMEKYPSFILARPEVFKRPWDSVVRPDEILNPGEKFFVVPRGTIRKLRRRIGKNSNGNSSSRSTHQNHEEKRVRSVLTWQPTLTSINES